MQAVLAVQVPRGEKRLRLSLRRLSATPRRALPKTPVALATALLAACVSPTEVVRWPGFAGCPALRCQDAAGLPDTFQPFALIGKCSVQGMPLKEVTGSCQQGGITGISE